MNACMDDICYKMSLPSVSTEGKPTAADQTDFAVSSPLPATTGSTVAGLDVRTLSNMKTFNYKYVSKKLLYIRGFTQSFNFV